MAIMRTGGVLALLFPLVCLRDADAFMTTTMAAKGFGRGSSGAKAKTNAPGGGEYAKYMVPCVVYAVEANYSFSHSTWQRPRLSEV